jgi:hypothetical protein
VYILNGGLGAVKGRNLKQYTIISSGSFAQTSDRVKVNDSIALHQWHATARYHLPLLFVGGELPDDFGVREENVVDYLCKFTYGSWESAGSVDAVDAMCHVTDEIFVLTQYMTVLR